MGSDGKLALLEQYEGDLQEQLEDVKSNYLVYLKNLWP